MDTATHSLMPFEEAMHLLRTEELLLSTEKVSLTEALGRTLAKNALADHDQPGFTKSAMDGYACRMADLSLELVLQEVIAAGNRPTCSIGPGQCSKIMTGVEVPSGADMVFMVEESEVLPSGTIRYTGSYRPEVCEVERGFSANIRFRGEDCHKGDVLIEAGTQLGAAHIAILAGLGWGLVEVYGVPRVAVISTGTELVEPEQLPGPGQIRNTNGPQLVAQLRQMGIVANYMGIAPDNAAETEVFFERALRRSDVVVFSGGVSMGDFDFVPEVLLGAGWNIRFRQVAVQPGKPTLFAVRNGQYCFGLPGNPVSSFVQFELMVKPFLERLCGLVHEVAMWNLPLGEDFKRSKAGRMSWIPVRVVEGRVVSVRYNGSGHITALAQADGFVAFPVGVKHLKKGDWIDVRQL
jgi:molybdopterin molybdotransferase